MNPEENQNPQPVQPVQEESPMPEAEMPKEEVKKDSTDPVAFSWKKPLTKMAIIGGAALILWIIANSL